MKVKVLLIWLIWLYVIVHPHIRVAQICKMFLWIYSNRVIPFYYDRVNTKKNFRKIRAFLGVPQTRWKIRRKYKGNGHNLGEKLLLIITFCQTHLFRNRFGCWSAFLLYFEKTSLKFIFMAISKLGHNGHYGYFPLLAIMAGLNMAINMVVMGVFSKCSKNADQQPKRFLKICVWQKVMTKTNF